MEQGPHGTPWAIPTPFGILPAASQIAGSMEEVRPPIRAHFACLKVLHFQSVILFSMLFLGDRAVTPLREFREDAAALDPLQSLLLNRPA